MARRRRDEELRLLMMDTFAELFQGLVVPELRQLDGRINSLQQELRDFRTAVVADLLRIEQKVDAAFNRQDILERRLTNHEERITRLEQAR